MPPFSHTWLPYIYLYGVGGIFFVIGIIITKKSGAMNLKKKKDKFWFKVLLFLTIAALYW
jgi:hypothetical protein